MKSEKWIAYEAKKKELKKQCKKSCILIWIIWFLIIAVIFTAILLTYKIIGIEKAVIALLLVLGFSLIVALNRTGMYIKTYKQQSLLIEQEEPFGRFNT